MTEIISITSSFFAIIALGAITKYFGLFDERSSQILTKFAFYIALPPLMIISIISTPVADFINFEYIKRYEMATFIVFILSFICAKFLFKLQNKENAIFALNSSFSNYGFLGIPLVFLIFGPKGALPASLILIFDSIFVLSLASLFSSKINKSSIFLSLFSALKTIAKNPIIVSSLIGLLLSFLDVKLAIFPKTIFNVLSGAAVPTALFAIGLKLVSSPIEKAYYELTFLTLIKLFLQPSLVTFLFIFWIIPEDETIDIMWVQIAIVMSCLPVAANVFALSEHYSAYVLKTSSAIVVTTLVSTLTIPVVLFLVSIENLVNFI